MKKSIKKILIITLMILLALIGATWIYSLDYYHADSVALESTQSATVATKRHIIYEATSNATSTGLIFYPGGKVQYEAYAPLVKSLSEQGITCILVHMPLNLAVFDMDAASAVRNLYPDIQNWYIAGHSLGGAMGATFIASHASDYHGIILLGAYSTSDLRDTGLLALSIYGSNDQVLSATKYAKYKENLPDATTEVIIEGGCHSYFGYYGMQDGDGTPTITREEQINQTAKIIMEWLKTISM